MGQKEELKNYKVYKMSLTALSPIFIGNGEKVNKSGYLYDPKEKIVHFIGERELISLLSEKKLLDSFLGECISGNFNFIEFIRKNHIENDFNIDDISKYSIKTYSDISTKEKSGNNKVYNKLNDINTFIKSSNGKPYIPGSSIKGAIRTAVVYGEILKNKNKYIDIFKDFLKTKPESKEFNELSRSIENNILGNKTKIFKNIIVSDTNEAELDNLYISRRFDVVTHEKEVHNLPIFMEVLKQGVKFDFLLTINGSFSIKDLSSYFNDFYNHNEEHNTFYEDCLNLYPFFQEKIEDKYPLFDNSLNMTPNIFIGGVNGFLTKTIIYAIRNNEDNNSSIERSEIADYLKRYFDYKFYDRNKNMPEHEHVRIDDKISPRSLKLVKKEDDSYIALGMCKIKVEKELC